MEPNSSPRNARAQAPALPPLVSSPADVGRLINELNMIDEALLQLGLRTSGTEVKIPKTSRLMDMMTDYNKLNLLKQSDRRALKQILTQVNERAPKMHFSFSSDPSAAFMEKLLIWLRREIHPYVLVTVGLQPTIGAGCIMRTTNKYFDLSLKQNFINNRQLLMDKINPSTA